MASREYPQQFPLKHAQKDMRFALALGDEVGQTMPVAAAANAVYLGAREKYGEDDFSAVYESVRPVQAAGKTQRSDSGEYWNEYFKPDVE